MAVRQLQLGPGECSDIETGARFFATLAFPALKEEGLRKEAEVALAGLYLRNANRIDGSCDPFTDPRLNELVRADPAKGKKALRTSARRLRDRLAAARSARPWIRDWLERPQALPAGMKKPSQRQIALFLSGGNQEAADNFQKRVLRPSRSALHFAVASELHDVLFGEGLLDRGIDLSDIGWFARVVELSNLVKGPICDDKRFGVREQDLLHLVWVH